MFIGETSMTFIHQDLWYEKLVPSSNQRGKPSRTILWTLTGGIIKSRRAFQILIVWGENKPL